MTTDAAFGLVEMAQDLAAAESEADLERAYLALPALVPALPMRGLYLFDPRTRAVERYAATNVSDVFLTRYERVGRDADPNIAWLTDHRRARVQPAGRSPRDWMDSHVYREVFSLHRMVHAVQAPVVVDDEIAGTLAFGGPDTRPADRARSCGCSSTRPASSAWRWPVCGAAPSWSAGTRRR